MTDLELATEIRRCADALNAAIKAAAEAKILCMMSFGSMSDAKATSIIVNNEADNAVLRIDLAKRL